MKKFILLLLGITVLCPVSGQNQPMQGGQWQQQKAFFTEKAGLTEEESNAFFPLYNELQQKKRELSRETRRFMREAAAAGASEEQSLKAIEAQAETNIKIAELEKEYLKKFKEVLPASKILKVQNAEEQFNSQILKDIQQSRSEQGRRWLYARCIDWQDVPSESWAPHWFQPDADQHPEQHQDLYRRYGAEPTRHQAGRGAHQQCLPFPAEPA